MVRFRYGMVRYGYEWALSWSGMVLTVWVRIWVDMVGVVRRYGRMGVWVPGYFVYRIPCKLVLPCFRLLDWENCTSAVSASKSKWPETVATFLELNYD